MPTNTLAIAGLSVKLLLPAFSDFAEKAELDVPLPITEARVTASHVSRTQPAVMVTVDGHHQFNWQSWIDDKDTGMKAQLMTGRIDYYDRSNAVAGLEGETRFMPLAQRQSVITTNQAREIALVFLKREGYDLQKANVNPLWVKQYMYQPDDALKPLLPLPAYSVKFVKKGVKKPEWHEILLEAEVSGLTKKITRFRSSPLVYKAVSADLRKHLPSTR